MAPQYELGYLANSDGSCLYRDEGTVVVVGVIGPADLRSSKQLSSARVEVDFGSYSALGRSGTKRMVVLMLRNVCQSVVSVHLFPRTCISVVVKSLADEDRLLEACINATCLALLDAALPLRDLFCARTEQWPVADDDDPDRLRPKCTATFVFLEHSLQNAFFCYTEGSCTVEQLQRSLQTARSRCTETMVAFRSMFVEKLNSSL